MVFPQKLRRLAAAADVIHICDHSNAMYVARLAGQPHLVTCNDMLAIRSAAGEFPSHHTRFTGRILQRWILAGLKRARRLTCISEATRRDVLRLTGHAPERVTVTPMGQNHPYAPVLAIARTAEARRRGEAFDAHVFSRAGLPAEPYILHVGGAQWYKNRPGVLAIHAALESRLKAKTPRLVFVGPQLEYAHPLTEARTGLSNDDLAALYSGAELMLFPSLEEGFGWPIIEAQACGCRVITTGRPPMTEVGGEAAIYLRDPADASEGAERVAELIAQDAEQRMRMVEAGIANAARFSTERMVREYTAIYRELLS